MEELKTSIICVGSAYDTTTFDIIFSAGEERIKEIRYTIQNDDLIDYIFSITPSYSQYEAEKGVKHASAIYTHIRNIIKGKK